MATASLSACATTPLPEGAAIEQQRAQTEAFVERFFSASKPCILNHNSHGNLTDAYREALYRASRMKAGA